MKKHIFKHLVPFALACLVTVGLFTGCEKKPEKETQQTTVSTQEETTTSEEVVTTTTAAPTTETENPAELSVDMLTSHWLMQSIQSNYVFRFYDDGTFESFFDCSSFDRSDKRLTYDSCGTYTLNGNELAIHVNATNYFSAFDYTVTYLRKDQHPEIKNWDIATGFPDDEWFFYETNFHGDPNYYDNAMYFAWVDDDAFYDSCKITGRPSDKTNAADTSASKPTQATEAATTVNEETTSMSNNGHKLTEEEVIALSKQYLSDHPILTENGTLSPNVLGMTEQKGKEYYIVGFYFWAEGMPNVSLWGTLYVDAYSGQFFEEIP